LRKYIALENWLVICIRFS